LLAGSQDVWFRSSSPDGLGKPIVWAAGKTDYVLGMNLFTYGYCIPFDRKGICELRLSPSAGFACVYANSKNQKITDVYSHDYDYSAGSNTGFTYAVGAGAGLTFHINKRFQIDIDYAICAREKPATIESLAPMASNTLAKFHGN